MVQAIRKEQMIQIIQRSFPSENMETIRELWVVLDEEFLHTKINNKDVFVDYGATEETPAIRCMQFKVVWMEIWQRGTEVGD